MTDSNIPDESHQVEHTCQAPMFTGIIPGCKRCEEITKSFGFEPYTWHTMRMAQQELNQPQTNEDQGETND